MSSTGQQRPQRAPQRADEEAHVAGYAGAMRTSSHTRELSARSAEHLQRLLAQFETEHAPVTTPGAKGEHRVGERMLAEQAAHRPRR